MLTESEMKSIRLIKNVRCFERVGPSSLRLRFIDRLISSGKDVNVGDIITMCWDHRDVWAVPYEWYGNEGFLLYDEVETSLSNVDKGEIMRGSFPQP